MYRIESYTSSGFPDVVMSVRKDEESKSRFITIELKIARRVREPYNVTFRPRQVFWHENMARHFGPAYILVSHNLGDWTGIYQAQDARRLSTEGVMEKDAILQWKGREVPWNDLIKLFTS
jgi:hypothetical protein